MLMIEAKSLRARNGIYARFQLLSLLQVPVHMVNFSILNHIAVSPSHPLYEAFSTQGFFWFTNMTMPDQYGILPVAGGLVTSLNIRLLSRAQAADREDHIKAGKMDPNDPRVQQAVITEKFLKFLPLIVIPIQMKFAAGFNLYWICVSVSQCLV